MVTSEIHEKDVAESTKQREKYSVDSDAHLLTSNAISKQENMLLLSIAIYFLQGTDLIRVQKHTIQFLNSENIHK